MIVLDSEAKIKILRMFSENAFQAMNLSKIIEKSGVSKAWCYKIARELKQTEIIKEKNKHYYLDFSNPMSVELKKTFDLEKLYSLGKEVMEEIFKILNKIKIDLKESLLYVALVGSTARIKRKKESDIDFLVVAKEKIKMDMESKHELNIIQLTKNEFEQKYMECDDFVLSSLSYGLILFDAGFIADYLRKPLPFPSPEQIEQKKIFAKKIIMRIYDLLGMGDIETAATELKYAVTQAIRIQILEKGIIPKSRYELAGQTGGELSKILSDILHGKKFTKKEIITVCEKIEL